MPRFARKFVVALSPIISRDAQLREDLRSLLIDNNRGTPPRNIVGLLAALYDACSDDPSFPEQILTCFYARELCALCVELDLGRHTRRQPATEAILQHFGFEPSDELASDDPADDDNEGEEGDAPERRRRTENRASFLLHMARQPELAARTLMPHQQQALTEALDITRTAPAALVSIATGGGKTMVGNEFVAAWLRENRGPVLWVTKDWELLRQALADATQRGIITVEQARRIGGGARTLRHLEELGRNPHAGVTYTTLASLLSATDGRNLRYLPGRPTLVVWDECHWADSAASSELIRTLARAGRITLLGLTATPKASASDLFIATTPFDFRTLADRGVIADLGEVISVATGARWNPERGRSTGDFAGESLRELGNMKQRNRLIVDTYCDGATKFGKTLLFACSVDQANALCREFRNRGIGVVAYHGRMSEADNQLALSRFRNGTAQLLVNVAKFTHGVDVPDIETLFLCRPTLSDILFSQMIGRAVRKVPGKETFRVVEFTDNLTRFGGQLHQATPFFQGTAPRLTPSRTRPSAPRDALQSFNPRGTILWLPASAEIPLPLQGLPFRDGQTFGIEFELTARVGDIPNPSQPAWHATAEAIRRALASALPGRVASSVTASYEGAFGDKDVTVWNVEYDSTCGWEITSPVLEGERGMLEVWSACQALDAVASALDLVVNANTGTHLHLGWLGSDHGPQLVRALRLARLLEPVLATLVAPSRVAALVGSDYDVRSANRFCRPVSTVFPESFLASGPSTEAILARAETDRGRYLTFNVRPIDVIGTVEVRMHSGTLDAAKILAWMSLWMQLLFVAERDAAPIPLVEDRAVIRPSRLIVPALSTILPNAASPRQQAFIQRLAVRSEEIIARWAKEPSLAPWLT